MGEEDRLPWLEAVEEEEGGDGPSVAKLIAAIVIGLVAIGVIVGGLFWLGNRGGPGAGNELIAAPEGDYKARPENPGGMNVSGEGDVSAAASAGAQPQGNLNVNAVPETPVTRRRPRRPRAAPGPAAGPAPPAPPRPAPRRAPPGAAPAAYGGATIQLGAFSARPSANRPGPRSPAASATSPRSPTIGGPGAGRRPHPLPAARLGAGRGERLRRLQVAGEACSVVDSGPCLE